MKHSTAILAICFLGLVFWGSCQKEREPFPKPAPLLFPIFDLGDTLWNTNNTSYEEIHIVIDSSSQTGFKLSSRHNYVPNQSSTYFIRIELDSMEEIEFLDSVAKVGYGFSRVLLSTFENGDTIRSAIATEGVYEWFPVTETDMGSSGWFKYHISTPQGGAIQNVKLGDNYIVFRFGYLGNEKLGWFNLVYQDSLCFIKEGYYKSTPNQQMVVGSK